MAISSGGAEWNAANYHPPEQAVRSILQDQALSHEAPDISARPEIKNLSKFRASRKGRIRVSKDVSQTSTETVRTGDSGTSVTVVNAAHRCLLC